MEQLQQNEWYELRSNTWRLLREREHILLSKHRPLLQYLVIPSFTDTWCIDFVNSNDTLAAYQTVWNVTLDIEAFRTAIERLKHPRPYTPTLNSTCLDVSNDRINQLVSRLNRVSNPLPLTSKLVSLDGISYELQFGDGSNGLKLQWNNYFPDEWPDELRDIVSEIDAMCIQPSIS